MTYNQHNKPNHKQQQQMFPTLPPKETYPQGPSQQSGIKHQDPRISEAEAQSNSLR